MQCRGCVFLEVLKKCKKYILVFLTSLLILVASLFMLSRDTFAADANLIDGKLTYEGKELSGPEKAGDNQSVVPSGSYFYRHCQNSDCTFIYSSEEIKAGSSAQLITNTLVDAENNIYSAATSGPITISIVENAPTASSDEKSDDSDSVAVATADDLTESCRAASGPLGWILCPISNWVSNGISYLYDILESFLVTKPLSTDTKSPIYLVWEYMRNIANVVFIIFIIIVVYSQVTGLGISNYGIKKVLPRVIIAAVLVNLSYIICALAIDASNVIGSSLGGVFTSIRDSVAASAEVATVTTSSGQAVETGVLIGGGAIAAIGVLAVNSASGLFFLILPVIISALIAILAALVTLIARQAIIILLVILAPLAFVAYLLPNTDKYFGKWKDLFIKMIVLYPLFSLLFGASQLAGWAIASSANNAVTVLLGIAVQFVPLALSPILAKAGGSLLAGIGNAVRKPFDPAQKGLRGWSDEKRSIARARQAAKGLKNIDAGKARYARAITPTNLAGRLAKRRAFRADSLRQAEDANTSLTSKMIADKKSEASEKTIWVTEKQEDGSMKRVKKTIKQYSKLGRREFENRVLSMENEWSKANLDNNMGEMSGAYDIGDQAIQSSINQQSARKMVELTQRMADAYFNQQAETQIRAKNNAKEDADYVYNRLYETATGSDAVSKAVMDHLAGSRGETGKNYALAASLDAASRVYAEERANNSTLVGKFPPRDMRDVAAFLKSDNPNDTYTLVDDNGHTIRTISKSDKAMTDVLLERAINSHQADWNFDIIKQFSEGGTLRNYRQGAQKYFAAAGFKDDAPWADGLFMEFIGQGSFKNDSDVAYHIVRAIDSGAYKPESWATQDEKSIEILERIFTDSQDKIDISDSTLSDFGATRDKFNKMFKNALDKIKLADAASRNNPQISHRQKEKSRVAIDRFMDTLGEE